MAAITVDSSATTGRGRTTFVNCTAEYHTSGTLTFSSFGNSTLTEYLAQSFLVNSNGSVDRFRIAIQKVGSPTDNVSLHLHSDSSGNPGTLMATADNVYNGARLITNYQWIEFEFSTPVSVVAGTTYHFRVSRSSAMDPTNYYRIAVTNGSAYADGALRAWNGTTWGTPSVVHDAIYQMLVQTPLAYYQVTQDSAIHIFKSTDTTTWTEQDGANAPSVSSSAYPFDACSSPNGPLIGTLRFTGTNTLRGRTFDMSTDTWQVNDWGSTDMTTDASNAHPVRTALDYAVLPEGGTQTAIFTSNTDDADLVSSRRTTAAPFVSSFLPLTSAAASTISAVVTDKAGGTGFTQLLFYDIVNGDFSLRSVVGGTFGTLVDIDAAAAAATSSHASAVYQPYTISSVDTITAAYIKSDDTLYASELTLESTSASVVISSPEQVSNNTVYAGKQLATCKYGGVRYVFAATATGIDYFTNSGSGWSAATNWKSGLISVLLSNARAIPGVGILVSYTDNGDVVIDWAVDGLNSSVPYGYAMIVG